MCDFCIWLQVYLSNDVINFVANSRKKPTGNEPDRTRGRGNTDTAVDNTTECEVTDQRLANHVQSWGK